MDLELRKQVGLEKHMWESLTKVYQGGKKSAWDRTLGNAIPVIMEYREWETDRFRATDRVKIM